MEQQEVDVRRVEAVEARSGRLDHVVVAGVSRGDLRREEHVLAVDVGVGDRAPDLGLVAVQLRRVDVSIAEFQGGRHRLVARLAGELPRSESHLRNARAVRLGVLHLDVNLVHTVRSVAAIENVSAHTTTETNDVGDVAAL